MRSNNNAEMQNSVLNPSKSIGYRSKPKQKPQVQPRQAGLGNNELLAKAMGLQEKYQNDKNKNNGLNLNNSLDLIKNITSSIIK